MSSKLRLAVMGLGWVATHRHIPSILNHPGFELIGLIDRHDGRAHAAARRYGVPLSVQSDALTDVPWLDDVDGLVLCTPPQTHAPLTLKALSLGKHILIEKPGVLSLHDAQEIERCAKAFGKTVAVSHNMPLARGAQKLKKAVTAGQFGEVQGLSMTLHSNPLRRQPSWENKLALGLFTDDLAHVLSVFSFFAQGQLRLEHAYAIPLSTPTTTPRFVHLCLRDEAGRPFTFDGHYDSPLSEWHMAIKGTTAMGGWDLFRDFAYRLPNDGEHGALSVLRTSLYAVGQHIGSLIPNGLAFATGHLDCGHGEVIRRFDLALRSGLADSVCGLPQLCVLSALFEHVTNALKEATRP